jgi:hypothetical protein
MLKPLTVTHAPKRHLIIFEELPRSVTPQEALLLGRAIQQAGIDALQGAKGQQTYPQEAV